LRNRLDVFIAHNAAVVVPEHGFEQHLDRVRQCIDIAHVLEGVKSVHGSLTERRVDGGPG
jgi:hypothetical protein